MVQLKCEDDVAAANELFGNDFTEAGPDLFKRKGVGTSYRPAAAYDVDLCSAAAALGFCEHDVFAAVCAGTCDGEVGESCTANRDAALSEFAKLHGDPARTCAQAPAALAGELFGRYAVVVIFRGTFRSG